MNERELLEHKISILEGHRDDLDIHIDMAVAELRVLGLQAIESELTPEKRAIRERVCPDCE